MRALVVTNLYPSEQDPVRGSFVRDQVTALRRLPDLELELFTFHSLGPSAYVRAAAAVRSCYRSESFDVVHAHFGLNLWPALAARGKAHGITLHGTDLAHPRSREGATDHPGERRLGRILSSTAFRRRRLARAG